MSSDGQPLTRTTDDGSDRSDRASAADGAAGAAGATRGGAAEKPYRGMRLWGRVLLVLAAHATLFAAIWWSLHPRVGDHNTVPGRINLLLTAAASVVFWLVLLQVSSKVPFKALCTLFLLVPFATFLVQYAGFRLWTTEVVQSRGEVVVTQSDRLFNGSSRVRVRDAEGVETTAWSTIGERGVNDYTFATIAVGQRYLLTEDPTGLSVPRIQPLGYDPADYRDDAWRWSAVALLPVLLTEAACVSALTRRRSQLEAMDDKPTRRRTA